MTQLFPSPPFFRQNAGASGLWLEVEGESGEAVIHAHSSQPIVTGDELHFSIAVYVLNAPLRIYHGSKLILTQPGAAGPIELDYTTDSNADYFEFRSEGEGALVEMSWPSITKS